MTAALVGTRITLSGAFTLSELSAISGVTTQAIVGTIYPLTIYTLTNRQITITGTGLMRSREKLIFTGQAAANDILLIDGGTFNIGDSYALNGYSYDLPIESIVFALTSGGTWNTTVLHTLNAGKLICKNALIRIPHSIWFEQNGSGQVLLENCVLDKRGSVGDIQTNHGGTVANNTVLRNSTIICDGQSGLTFRNTNPPTIDNVTVIQARDAWNNESGSYKVVRGLVPETGSKADVAQFVSNETVLVNPRKGVQFIWGGHLANDQSNVGSVAVWQEIEGSIKTPTGVAVSGAVRYLTDTAVAADATQTSAFTKTGSTVNPTLRRVYIQTSDSNGLFAQQDILIGTGKRTAGGLQIAGGNANRVRPRGRNTTAGADATDDVYEYTDLKYGYLPQTNPVVLKAGTAGVLNFPSSAIIDSTVTLSESAVGALTNIDNLDDLYDAGVYWKTRAAQANIEYLGPKNLPIVVSGVSLTTSINIVVDGTAAAAFAIDTATNTLTIKSLNLTAGMKYKSLATTGTITTTNGATITSTYTDSAGTRVAIKERTGKLLSTYAMVNGTPVGGTTVNGSLVAGWVPLSVSRVITVQPTDQIRIVASYYGSKPTVFNMLGSEVDKFTLSLDTETAVDTEVNATTRDAIANSFNSLPNGQTIEVTINRTFKEYTPNEVVAGFDYYIVSKGFLLHGAMAAVNNASLYAISAGTIVSYTPAYKIRMADLDINGQAIAPTTDGYEVPLVIYYQDPQTGIKSTMTKLNASGAYLGTAPWTQSQASIGDSDQALIAARAAAQVWASTTRTLTSSSAPTASQTAAAVRTELAVELARVDAAVSTRSTQASVNAIPTAPLLASAYVAPDNAGIASIAQKTDELHRIHGLNVTEPLTVTPTARTAGDIRQNLTGDGVTTTTVTRA